MAKKSKNKGGGDAKLEPKVTMKALQEMSDSEGEELPPESEWSKEATALKEAIESGTFDTLLKQSAAGSNKDDESFEEVDLEDESSDGSVEDQAGTNKVALKQKLDEEVDDNDDDSDSDGPSDDDEEVSDEEKAASEDEDEQVNDVADEQEEEMSENDDDDEKSFTMEEKNNVSVKALHVVTEALVAEKESWPWAETFDIIPVTPLPFYGDEALNIHDDLKREVAFYDMALEAVLEAREKCNQAGIPFTRPDDFFAEMIKTDGKASSRFALQRLSSIRNFQNDLTFFVSTSFIRSHGQCEGSLDFREQKDGSGRAAQVQQGTKTPSQGVACQQAD